MSNAPAGPTLAPPWGAYPLTDDGTVAVRLGSIDLWIRRREGEVRIAHSDRGAGEGDLAAWGAGAVEPEPAGEPDWSRWATASPADTVFLRPALPDRPVVLKPEWPFRLLPGAEAQVFVRVPLRVRVELPAADGRTHMLLTVPSVVMSDTWFGDTSAGELAYWLPTTARRAMAPELFAPHVAVCPLHMRNETADELLVDKVALRVAHLSLFQGAGGIWADESRVRYLGLEEGSQIEMSGRAPAQAGAALQVAPPESPVQRGFRARTFDRLRSIQPFGGA